MGHSFGTIVISGMLGGPNANRPLVRPVDSVALVQGAVSLWCYAPSIPFRNAGPGYFHRILPDGKVSGPLVTTQSRYDKAVGQLYPLASHIHGSASFAVGGAFPSSAGSGLWHPRLRRRPIQTDMSMLPASGSYGFEPRKVYNLESSQYICKGGGASGAHSDIAGPEVAHAIWEAAFASVVEPRLETIWNPLRPTISDSIWNLRGYRAADQRSLRKRPSRPWSSRARSRVAELHDAPRRHRLAFAVIGDVDGNDLTPVGLGNHFAPEWIKESRTR